MEKWQKVALVILGVISLVLISVPLVYLATVPKFEGVVSQIIETEEKTTILLEDGKSTSFSKPCVQQIVSLEVGDTLKYTNKEGIYGAECWEVRSSSDRAAKKALYEQRTGIKGVIARIEFGPIRSYRNVDASVLFTDGATKVFSLANAPKMACAEVGDTIVYKGKRKSARCVSFRPHLTTE